MQVRAGGRGKLCLSANTGAHQDQRNQRRMETHKPLPMNNFVQRLQHPLLAVYRNNAIWASNDQNVFL